MILNGLKLFKWPPMVVVVFASTIASLIASAEADPIFDVRNCGATGSGAVLDTPGVNAAIAAAAKAGGGTVYFSAGTYLCFSIHLLSNVQLYLAQGSTILAADSPTKGQTTGQLGGTYDLAEPQNPLFEKYQDYGHSTGTTR